MAQYIVDAMLCYGKNIMSNTPRTDREARRGDKTGWGFARELEDELAMTERALHRQKDEMIACLETRRELEAAAKKRHVATLLLSDPEDERDGFWLSIPDQKRLTDLPAGTKLYIDKTPG